MRSFKQVLKALTVLVAFILTVALITEAVCAPYLYGTAFYYQDGKVRDSMAGTLDLLVSGASQAQRAVSPAVLDSELGCNSYNLSTPTLSMEGKYILLKKELERNPVKTVIIELCYDTIARDRDEVGPEGDHYALGRFTNPLERYAYFFRTARIGEYGEIYNELIKRSMTARERVKKGTGNRAARAYDDKGFVPLDTLPIEMPDELFSEKISTELSEENIYFFNKTVELCKSKDIEVYVISTPLSNGAIASYDALDTIQTEYRKMCDRLGVPFYNFSLYRGKTELFPDWYAFCDRNHVGIEKADEFTALVADVIKKARAGDDVSALFYDSYAQLCEAELSISPKTAE